MGLSLHLMGGFQIWLDVEPEAWTAAFERALRESKVLQVEDPQDGGTLGVNPQMVVYWKAESPPRAERSDRPA
jgi:hypothetical protein